MRFVYCDACGKVSTNVWTEHDICTICGRPADPVRVSRPWQSWLGNAALVAVAVALLALPIDDYAVRVVILLTALVLVYAVSAWSLKSAKERVLREALARKRAPEGKL